MATEGNKLVTTVTWSTGQLGYVDGGWVITKDGGDGVAQAALAVAKLGQLLYPDGPATGHPGARVGSDVATMLKGTVEFTPLGEPAGTVY